MPKISLGWGPVQPFLNIDHDFDNICFLNKWRKKFGTKFGSWSSQKVQNFLFGGLNEWEISAYFGPLFVLVKTLLDALTNSALLQSESFNINQVINRSFLISVSLFRLQVFCPWWLAQLGDYDDVKGNLYKLHASCPRNESRSTNAFCCIREILPGTSHNSHGLTWCHHDGGQTA